MALFAVAGCNDYCDDSAVKQIDCGQFPPELGLECTTSDHDQCLNGCVADASCDDLKSGKYKVCTAACPK